jgi:hypothetical protein
MAEQKDWKQCGLMVQQIQFAANHIASIYKTISIAFLPMSIIA